MAMQFKLAGESNLYTNDNKECTIEKLKCGDDDFLRCSLLLGRLKRFYWIY
ncbi:hypothetical protein C2W64_03555 [Brevibacillus laterosporus]|nr:hypothetical protein C2W64_03555 [Brevibacillus laterosporus]